MHFIAWNTFFNVTVIMSARRTCKITQSPGNMLFNKFRVNKLRINKL